MSCAYDHINQICLEHKKIGMSHPILHFHNAYEIVLLIESDNMLFVKDIKYPMKSCQIMIIPPHTVHQIYYKHGAPYHRYVINFEYDYIFDVINSLKGSYIFEMLDEPLVLNLDTITFQKTKCAFSTLINNYKRIKKTMEILEIQEMQIKLTLAAFLIDIHGIFKSRIIDKQWSLTTDLVNDIANYIGLNFAEHITLELLEKEFSISKSYMCRKFKKFIGVSIIDFLQYTRIANAQKLLAEDLPVMDVCFLCGFNNIQHFYSVFKKITNQTPGLYKRSVVASEKPQVFDYYPTK